MELTKCCRCFRLIRRISGESRKRYAFTPDSSRGISYSHGGGNGAFQRERFASTRWTPDKERRKPQSQETGAIPTWSKGPTTLPSRGRPLNMTEEERQSFGRLISRLSANLAAGKTQSGDGSRKIKSIRRSFNPGGRLRSVSQLYNGRLGLMDSIKDDEQMKLEMLDIAREQIAQQSNELDLLNWALLNIFPQMRNERPGVELYKLPRNAAAQAGCVNSSAFRGLPKRNVYRIAKKSGDKESSPGLSQFSPAYPFLIAEVMSAFRKTFKNPYLAITIFEHARRLNMTSYILGCGTDAYNQMLQIQWTDLGSLQGVHRLLTEMKVNAVPTNHATRTLAQSIRDKARMDLLAHTSDTSSTDNSEHWFRKDRKLIKQIEVLASDEMEASPEDSRYEPDLALQGLDDPETSFSRPGRLLPTGSLLHMPHPRFEGKELNFAPERRI